MSFSPPKDLREIVLYIWKILDNPQILKDTLHNFIAFDLNLLNLAKTKQFLNQAIDKGYLIEDESLEYVSLNHDLNKDFQEWQKKGIDKTKEMQALLATSWRAKPPISLNEQYLALRVDLIDPEILALAEKIRASTIKITNTDFKTEISGQIKENSGENKGEEYPFVFNISQHKIIHNCPDFIQNRYKHKKFCSHLGRIVMKLYATNPDQTVDLLREIVSHRELWELDIKLV